MSRAMAGLAQSLLSRRGLFGLAVAAPLLLAGDLRATARAQAVAACGNPDTLPSSQKGMRRSLGFKLETPDPKKRCGNCTFFTATAGAGGCGKCQLLSGGAVETANTCDNWVAKT